MQNFFLKIRDSKWFGPFIIIVILLAGVVVGIQTYKGFASRHYTILHLIDQTILWIFVIEIIVKIGAEGRKPWRYFFDSWNVFDFLIVAVCFMPFEAAEFAAVLRLARILRVLKLVTALPKLQMLVGALLKSIPSMGYVFVLLLLEFYIYAAMGTFFFSENDPVHFRDLQTSMLSLFRAVTLEDWTDLMYINMYGSDAYGYDAAMDAQVAGWGLTRVSGSMTVGAAAYFVSFILLGSMIVLNLFIGVIMTGMDEMKAETEMEHQLKKMGQERNSAEEMQLLRNSMQELMGQMETLQARLQMEMNTTDNQNGERQVVPEQS